MYILYNYSKHVRYNLFYSITTTDFIVILSLLWLTPTMERSLPITRNEIKETKKKGNEFGLK